MSNDISLWAGLLILTTAGCGGAGDDAPVGSLSAAAKAAPGAPGPVLTLPIYTELPVMTEALTWTSGGDLAVVSGKTGAVKQLAPTAGLSGEPDVVYDPWHAEAVVFEYDDGNETGEIASYPAAWGAGGVTLGSRLHEQWVGGEARLLPSPLGRVIFEASYGERWKMLFDDEETTSSVAAPCPASAWITTPDGHDFTVNALTYSDEGPLFRRSADVVWHKIASPATSSLGLAPAGDPPTARLMSAPALGDAALFDVVGSDLAVRLVSGPSAAPASTLPLGASGLRIEQVIGMDSGEVALLLISGSSRIVAVELGIGGVIKSVDTLALPGAVRTEMRFFSHDLGRVGPHRALAATSDGVFAIDVQRSGAGVHLTLDAGFAGAALRGPIAAIAAYEP